MVISLAVVAIALAPLWGLLGLHVPGEAATSADLTFPIDAIFYVRNAELGYRGGESLPVSVPFHPLLSVLTRALPGAVQSTYRLWLISVVAGIGALAYLVPISRATLANPLNPRALLLLPLIPGGLVIATGNAESLCLLLACLLCISVLDGYPPGVAFLWGALAILAKPNAVYMVPFLAVHMIGSLRSGDRRTAAASFFGVAGVCLAWLAWIAIVDTMVAQPGAYWLAREAYIPPHSAGVFTFLSSVADGLVGFLLPGDGLRYFVALAVPLVDLVILLAVPTKHERHRLAIAAGLATMVAVTLATNNPNKVLVYSMAYPFHAVVGMGFLRDAFTNHVGLTGRSDSLVLLRPAAGVVYLLYCLLLLVFFAVGTPLQWYY